MRRASRKGVNFVSRWEGFMARPYWDVNHWSIGYGTPSSADASPIDQRTGRSMLRAWLNKRVVPYIPRRWLMRQREIDALASFGYNLGAGALLDSTLNERLTSREGFTFKGRKRIYREEIPRWDKSEGKPLAGLTRRRAAEVEVACDADYGGRP